jgi:DNA-binding MarR family transcriptional regulator
MDNLGAALADTSRLLRYRFEAEAKSIGVTRSQWQVLTILARQEGIRQVSLSEILEVEPITVCRMVDRLAESGLVERRSNPKDRRAWKLYLTARAYDLLTTLRPIADRLFAEALDGVGDTDRAVFYATLERIRHNLSSQASRTKACIG